VTGSDPGVVIALGVALMLVAAQRIWELRLSSRNARTMAARGGVERGRGHFPLFVVLHSLWPLGLAAEVWLAGARPGSAWPIWLALLIAAEALRMAAIRSLGERWNVRIWVIPGAPPVRSGAYRWLRHPNYLAVTLELIAIPLLFGAWRTAIGASFLNAIALGIRIPLEERALSEAAASGPHAQRVSRNLRTSTRPGVS
jgi:methyltransferase